MLFNGLTVKTENATIRLDYRNGEFYYASGLSYLNATLKGCKVSRPKLEMPLVFYYNADNFGTLYTSRVKEIKEDA